MSHFLLNMNTVKYKSNCESWFITRIKLIESNPHSNRWLIYFVVVLTSWDNSVLCTTVLDQRNLFTINVCNYISDKQLDLSFQAIIFELEFICRVYILFQKCTVTLCANVCYKYGSWWHYFYKNWQITPKTIWWQNWKERYKPID